jgi:hypothetical protein
MTQNEKALLYLCQTIFTALKVITSDVPLAHSSRILLDGFYDSMEKEIANVKTFGAKGLPEPQDDKIYFPKSKLPPRSNEDSSFSVTVLLYCEDQDIHTVGWYDFEMEGWAYECQNELPDFVWTFLQKPKVIVGANSFPSPFQSALEPLESWTGDRCANLSCMAPLNEENIAPDKGVLCLACYMDLPF